MSFMQIGNAAQRAVEKAGGDNILVFPYDAQATREERIARSISALERDISALRQTCGVAGAARITILLLEELVETYADDVRPCASIARKLCRLSKIFVEQDAAESKM